MLHTADTALYGRLSKEDRTRGMNLNKGNSDSIESQMLMLHQYAAAHGLQVYDEYTDDGYTGTNFQRPDFMRMMEDIRAGKVKTVIVKDLSRLGRDYIESGRYQEVIFPELGTRLIAIGDGYDSDNEDGNDIAPFKNLFNDFYPRDISKKTRNALNARARNGEYLGPGLYGYCKDPNDRHKLVPDPDTAPVVRRIFSMVCGGYGFCKVARELSNEGIPTPGAVKGHGPRTGYHRPTDWHFPTVRAIVMNPMYLGHTIHGVQKKLNYKSSKMIQMPEENWIVVEGTHEPLISRETWDLAHKVISTRSKPTGKGTPHIFSGLLKCGTCGATMAKDSGNGFSCQRYKVYGKEQCTNHRITMEQLNTVVLASIRDVSEEVRADRDGFIERLTGKGLEGQRAACETARRERHKLEKRLSEIGPLVKKAFEKNAADLLPDDVYTALIEDYAAEKEDVIARLADLDAKIVEMEQETEGPEKFVALVEQYTDIQALDRDILHALIEKIVIHQGYKDQGVKHQEVDIYFRFIGRIDDLSI
ncbi:recombinase [Oscillospiraceae bacterium]|nr:recombinase [Oscillospiraceae bacterium]BDF76802.1 recombinase [Oscillospiraceae bacterium]